MSEIDLLMQNAQLRDEMEPFLDESVYLVDLDKMSISNENEFLTSLLAWEKAPVLPISQWFEPELAMPDHHSFSDTEVNQQLHQSHWKAVRKEHHPGPYRPPIRPTTLLPDCS